MNGLMMHQPLLVSSLLRHAERHHGEQQVVSRLVEGGIHRTTYRELAGRARRMAHALKRLGVDKGTRVGTIAWNTHRHLELYYAVSGSGAVLHTLNPRLHADQVAWIVAHAHDEVLFVDKTFLPLVESLAGRLPSVRHVVLMVPRAHMPAQAAIANLLCYEDLLEAESDVFAWPEFDERSASGLCYTSGTTGHPKGVLYSHRSTLLHAWASALPDAINLSARDAVLPVVPMFHVNAWGLPYSCLMVGAKLVMPGPGLDGASLHDLIEAEGVTLSAGVPTVWQGLLSHVQAKGRSFTTMKRTLVGGSACPPAMIDAFEDGHGVHVMHGWGMTELSPLGTVCAPKGDIDPESWRKLQARQGRSLFGIDMKVVAPDGVEVPWDGRTPGELLVSGHWVVGRYMDDGGNPLRHEDGRGWFPTGDVATIDANGFMQVTDRSKDVIKSGGEWIGSIDLENVAMAHPGVAMAACIAARHPKWDERPLLVVARKPGATVTREELIASYEGKVAKWWTPDDVVFVDAIPLGATGKMLKNVLREQYGNTLVDAAAPVAA